jgi:HAD superfamily hydrolase (TIGR01509 family)
MAKAVIFDLDGVVLLSIPIYQKIFSKKLYDKYRIKIEPDEIPINGVRMEHALKKILDENKIHENDETLKKMAQEGRVEFSNMGLGLNPGWKKFALGLKKRKIKVGLGTNTSRIVVDSLLKKLKADVFDAITTFDDVKNGKPDPEIYLKCASLLKVNPKDCIVFEDTLTGITAAKRAGMKVIALTTSMEKQFLQDADRIIDNFSDIDIDEL